MISAISTPESKKHKCINNSFLGTDCSPVVKTVKPKSFIRAKGDNGIVRKNVTHLALVDIPQPSLKKAVVRKNTTHVGLDYVVESVAKLVKDENEMKQRFCSEKKKRRSEEYVTKSVSPLKMERKRKTPCSRIEKGESCYFSKNNQGEINSLMSFDNEAFKNIDLQNIEKEQSSEKILHDNDSKDLFIDDSLTTSHLDLDLLFENSMGDDIKLTQSLQKEPVVGSPSLKQVFSSVPTSLPNILNVLPHGKEASSIDGSESDCMLSSPMDFGLKNTDKVPNTEKIEVLNQNSSVISISKSYDCGNWNDNSMITSKQCGNLSAKFHRQLLDNVSKLSVKGHEENISKVFNFSFSSDFELNSSFHELGPFFGLSSKVRKMIQEYKGIKELYDWQAECLNLPAIQNRRNLIYSLPTSGGKTLVAEILILREIICHKKNVLFILPFVSVVQEKVRSLSQFGIDLNFLVEEYAAGKGVIPPRKRRRKQTVIIATIEKGLAVIESLLEHKRLQEFGLVVVDELHLLGEESGRGATLEMLLTHILHSNEKIHVVGMSATIGNLKELGQFLRADLYTGDFRPVELTEYVKCGNNVFTVDWTSEDALKHVRTINSPLSGPDPDGIGELVQEVIPQDCVLIFCPTKKNCENVALLLSNILPKELQNHKKSEKMSLYRALANDSNGSVCSVLKKTLPYGVVYHHSGLTGDERKLLEEGFRDETICVICCTSTLAAGVNLPARRVILRSPYIGLDFINLSKYKQMVGRAGRAGYGSYGESYLICQATDTLKVGQLLRSEMDESISRLNQNNSEGCCELCLSSISLGVATTRRQLRTLLSATLMSIQSEKLKVNVKELTDECITKLYKQGALRITTTETRTQVSHECGEDEENVSKLDLNVTTCAGTELQTQLYVTGDTQLTVSRLGRAAMKGSMSLQQSHELYTDLIQAESCLVLLTSLHLLFIVTPYDISHQIVLNNMVYFNVYSQLKAKELQTAKIVGITDVTMRKLMTGQRVKNVSENILKRFYVTLMLNELWKQQSVWDVSVLFQVPRGLVQNLMTSASSFASNVLRFCEELEELWPFKALLSEFAPRLAHCCSAELLPLLELPAVKKGRAKQLYTAGYKTLQMIATASPKDLVDKIDHLPRRVADQIVAAAKLNLLEKVENLKEEADEVLENLGQPILNRLDG